ncbi:MAG TPA: mechanosensitive ion channel family protein [Thermoanaerobaculia bacterium]|nr:mechanosensitive ion channel family protein [Thermoanaerobaculia bacterium]
MIRTLRSALVVLAVLASLAAPATLTPALAAPQAALGAANLGKTTATQSGTDQGSAKQADNEQKGSLWALVVASFHNPDRWQQVADQLLSKLTDLVPLILSALLVLALFWVFHRAVARILRRFLDRGGADRGLRGVVLNLAKYSIFAVACVIAANQLGFKVGSLIAGLGVAGLAVGLAAQDTLGNLFAGLVILWDRPFHVGDYVEIAGTFGRVTDVGLRSVHIRTLDHLDAILPNRKVVEEKIVNHTLTPRLRLGVPLGIAYGEDIRKARQVLLAAVQGHAAVQEEPAPSVVVTELADSAVNLELRVWLRDPAAERATYFELLELAKLALDEAGIVIPFPQRTLHWGDGPLPIAERPLAAAEEESRDSSARDGDER